MIARLGLALAHYAYISDVEQDPAIFIGEGPIIENSEIVQRNIEPVLRGEPLKLSRCQPACIDMNIERSKSLTRKAHPFLQRIQGFKMIKIRELHCRFACFKISAILSSAFVFTLNSTRWEPLTSSLPSLRRMIFDDESPLAVRCDLSQPC